ncbi:MAG: DNA mismatch repair endonuclease MutL, partial [Bacteroidales bacterium]
DLFTIRTLGFRGEALASIAAVAQVELKTKNAESETGTQIEIEGEAIKANQACSCAQGSNIRVKNLYFNTPARRQFLKSDEVEFRYIEEEFYKIALAHPKIAFTFYKDDKCINRLESTVYNQRIIQLMGNAFQSRLVKVSENLANIKINGYICTPDYTTKTRSKQYLFINQRYIRHIGLNHAIEKAYKELVPEKNYPAYFLYLEMDPKNLDVNIHPTKTEVRFNDEKMIYGILFSVIKHAIGLNQIAPTIDFDTTNKFNITPPPPNYNPQAPSLNLNPNYNPFHSNQENKNSFFKDSSNEYKQTYLQQFQHLHQEYEDISSPSSAFVHTNTIPSQISMDTMGQSLEQSFLQHKPNLKKEFTNIPSNLQAETFKNAEKSEKAEEQDFLNKEQNKFFQFQNAYIITSIKSGILIIDQQAASERIIFESYQQKKDKGNIPSQRTLFPQVVEFSSANTEMIRDLQKELEFLGWEMEWVGGHSFIVNAMPADAHECEAQSMLEEMLDIYTQNIMRAKTGKKDNISAAMAKQLAIKKGTYLQTEEIISLIDRLFSCPCPNLSPSGKKTFWILPLDNIVKSFQN